MSEWHEMSAKRVLLPQEASALRGTAVPAYPPTELKPYVPTIISDQVSGEPVIIVGKVPEHLMPGLRRAMRAMPMSTTLRSSGMRNISTVFGYAARNQVLRREGCRVCGAATDAPAAHDTIFAAATPLSEMLHDLNPAQSTADRLRASQILPEWRMGTTQWTSGVLNETSALPYHTDANNMPTWNAMIVVRRGTRGGHFNIPEYGLTLPCRDGDVIFMPAWRLMHGVTPIRSQDEDGYRYTAVYYTVSRMKDCLPADEELAQARTARSEREDTLLERQRASGLLAE